MVLNRETGGLLATRDVVCWVSNRSSFWLVASMITMSKFCFKEQFQEFEDWPASPRRYIYQFDRAEGVDDVT
jgi:hypothetical protein